MGFWDKIFGKGKPKKDAKYSIDVSLKGYEPTFTQFGADLDSATKKVLSSGARMMAALRQDRFTPLADWQQALLIFAVSGGFADKIEPDDMEAFSASLYRWFPTERPDLVELLSTGNKLDAKDQEQLRAALSVFAEAI